MAGDAGSLAGPAEAGSHVLRAPTQTKNRTGGPAGPRRRRRKTTRRAEPRAPRDRKRGLPPLTKMRLKRLLSFGGSCTFGIAARGRGWVTGRSVPRGWAPRRTAAKSRVRAMGQFIGLEFGVGRFGSTFAQRWEWKKGRSLSKTPSVPALLWGKQRLLQRTARWQPGSAPPPPAGRSALARSAQRQGPAGSW